LSADYIRDLELDFGKMIEPVYFFSFKKAAKTGCGLDLRIYGTPSPP
jgi:hypothetical protein